ncbi:hypothetical protein LINPERHAP2_LOCUS43751 [Linum perenne]
MIVVLVAIMVDFFTNPISDSHLQVCNYKYWSTGLQASHVWQLIKVGTKKLGFCCSHILVYQLCSMVLHFSRQDERWR